MTWRAAHCLLTLRDEINAAHPNRDKTADGIRASAAHHQQNPNSDHEPDAHGVVHAIDITTKPGEAIGADNVIERLRRLGEYGDPRLHDGYLIYRRRIYSAKTNWHGEDYHGTDPHVGHFHLSVTYDVACDTAMPWHLYDTPPTPSPQPEDNDDMLIYFSDEDQDGLEIASDHGNLFGIPDERTRDSLVHAGFKKVAVSAAYFALLKSKATL